MARRYKAPVEKPKNPRLPHDFIEMVLLGTIMDNGTRALAEDLNLDGSSDLVLGNSEGSGNLFLFYGPMLGTVDTTAADAWYGGEFGIGGYNPILAGDTDGDGNLEVASGAAPENNYSGAVVLLEVEVW